MQIRVQLSSTFFSCPGTAVTSSFLNGLRQCSWPCIDVFCFGLHFFGRGLNIACSLSSCKDGECLGVVIGIGVNKSVLWGLRSMQFVYPKSQML